MQRLILSVFPEDFDAVVSELTRMGVVILRQVRDLGVITAHVERVQVAQIRAIRGVQDAEVEEGPFVP